jgi:hypothetical protein
MDVSSADKLQIYLNSRYKLVCAGPSASTPKIPFLCEGQTPSGGTYSGGVLYGTMQIFDISLRFATLALMFGTIYLNSHQSTASFISLLFLANEDQFLSFSVSLYRHFPSASSCNG